MSATCWRRFLGACAVLLGLTVAVPAFAQQTRQPTQVNPTAEAVNEQKLLEALKSGGAPDVSGRITIPDSRAGSLIQPAGRDWQSWRQTTLPRLGAGAFATMIVALLVFLAMKGRIRVEAGLSGRQVERFNPLERFAHWLTATAFIVLALSGLNVTYGRQLLLPVMGADTFTAFAQWAKYLHNYMSFAFVLGIVLMFVQWVIFNLPLPRDFVWIAKGGGIFGKSHPPAGKFNAGQKLVFWITILGGLTMAATGYAMMFPFYSVPAAVPGNLSSFTTSVDGLQWVTWLHGLTAVLMITVIIAHIYIGTLGMQGAFWSMGTGKVDVNWAKQHHSIWAAHVVPKDGPAKPAPAE
jgi:formate dehydrogenase subunit gamma